MKTYGRCLKSFPLREQSLPEEYDNACRLCLTKDNVTIRIYNDDVVPISLKLRYCIALEVAEDDGLPHSVCHDCMSQLDQAYAFKKRCLAADVKLRQFIKVPSFSHSFSWDSSLQETTLSEDSENSRSKDACTIKIEEDCLMYPRELCNSNKGDEDIDCGDTSVVSSENCLDDNNGSLYADSENSLCEPMEITKMENIVAVVVENGYINEENTSSPGQTEHYVESDGSELMDFRRSTRIMLSRKRKLLQTPQSLTKSSEEKLSDSGGEEIILLRKKQLNSSKANYRCSRCNSRFSSYKELFKHINVHHFETLKVCNACRKSFISNSTLERHMRTHTGERPYQCETCGKKFSQKEILNRHKYTHTGEKPFKCQRCSFCCSFSDTLSNHIRTFHLDSEPRTNPRFPCAKCDKAFHHASGLSRHQSSHSGILFKCTGCSKVFSDKSSVKRHHIKAHPEAYLKNDQSVS